MEVAMRSSISFVFALLWWVAYAAPPARAAGEQACNVNVDVVDTDPKGTNVRASPGGNVTATLKNAGDGWIGVHVIGQQGDWYEIDRASSIGADEPPGGTPIFQGKGWLHKSVLGVSGMQNGGVIYAGHDIASPAIVSHASSDEVVQMLGCWGTFLQVRWKNGIGWTREACTNMNTTCS